MTNLSIQWSQPSQIREIIQEKDTSYKAIFTIDNIGEKRLFHITSNAPIQKRFDNGFNPPQGPSYREYLVNPRQFIEANNYPSVDTNHIWFDTLYALAIEEVGEASVANVHDNSYFWGKSLPKPAEGGYFQTGLFWTYVWTRDISYSVNLSLALLDPIRCLNCLKFKISEPRKGSSGNLQVIQDTGSGGSYPISSDRVVWSFGSEALLQQLQGNQKEEFARCSYEALKNTIEHDRQLIFDAQDGLYRGEQSFLDWREQSYPFWTKYDPVEIGMSKALSTNCCHFHALKFTASLAGKFGHSDEQTKYNQWAEDLRTAINKNLYLPEQKLYSTFITTTFAPGAAHQYDLLGNALAILLGIADETQAADIVSHYPHFPKGASVIFPQQRDIPIYHNQANWPFVTAYWLKAAKKVGNDQAVTMAISSLVRGAALSLTNSENFDAVTGKVEIESKDKEPVVNSPRQLWSIAGYLSMIHDIIFGLSWTDSAISISPYITREFRNHLLPKSDQLVLNDFPYQEHKLNIKVNLPPVSQQMEGAYTVKEIRLNGQIVTSEIAKSMLKDSNVIEVDLQEGETKRSPISRITNLDDYRYRFGPRQPIVESITAINNQLEIKFNLNGETPDEVSLNVYRDGQLVASGLSGSLTTWRDQNTAGEQSPSYCYNLEAVYICSGTVSQRSHPFCYWGQNNNRIHSVSADQFSAVGGQLVDDHGKKHYEDWGEPGHSITIQIKPQFSGSHAIQVLAGNGAGAIYTGITCAVKRLQMTKLDNNEVVADGYLMMPHLGLWVPSWDIWKDSSLIFTEVDLIADQNYEIKIFVDDYSINMSNFTHNTYYMGTGGIGGAYYYVNIAEIKLNSLGK